MPLDTHMVGATTEPICHEVDARWLMAFAAGVGDCNPMFLDTASGAITAHPVFPVCLEWPALLATPHLPGFELSTPEEAARGVHASHDLHLYRPITPGQRLLTTATIIGLRRIRPGALQTVRLDTVDEDGVLFCRTYHTNINRGVEVTGAERVQEKPPRVPALEQEVAGGVEIEIPVSALAAHHYTECARIWNPIHTDRAVALAAGLPDIVLHGTATLALAVSRIVNDWLEGDGTRVVRLGVRFTGFVALPSTLKLHMTKVSKGLVLFKMLGRGDASVLEEGYVVFH